MIISSFLFSQVGSDIIFISVIRPDIKFLNILTRYLDNQISDTRLYICPDIRFQTVYLFRYPVSGCIFVQISGFRLYICIDIRFQAVYLYRYPIPGCIFVQISGFRLYICPDIRFQAVYLYRYQVSGCMAIHPVFLSTENQT